MKDAETAGRVFLILAPLIFAPSAFIPVQTMPGWLQPGRSTSRAGRNAARDLTLGLPRA